MNMVGPAGFEPATSSTPRKRPTKLSYGPKEADSPRVNREGQFARTARSGKLESGVGCFDGAFPVVAQARAEVT